MYSFDVKKDQRRGTRRQQLQRIYQFDNEDRDSEVFNAIIDQLMDAMDDGK